MTNNQQTSKGDNRILDSLFGSETRASILRALIFEDEKTYRLIELSKKIGMDSAGVHREISNLVSLGIVNKNENQEYKIDKKHILFEGLKILFKKSESLLKKYYLFEEVPVCYPIVACDYFNKHEVNSYFEKNKMKSRISKSLLISEYPNLKIYLFSDESKEISKEILSKIIENSQFGLDNIKEVISLSKELFDLSEEMEKENYANFSNKEILNHLKKYFFAYEKIHLEGWIGNSSDMPEMIFTEHLLFILKDKIKKKGSLLSAQNIFSKLTTPIEESFIQKEYENLLKVLIEINQNSSMKNLFRNFEPRHILNEIKNKPLGKKIEKHAKDFGWLGYGFIGPCWDETYFIGIMSSLIRQNENPKKILENIKKDKEDLIKDQEKITMNLELTEDEKSLFKIARGFVFTKGLRKDSMFKFYSRIELFYKEIARRLYVSVTDIRFCYPHEFEKLIEAKPEFIKLLRERQKFSLAESRGKYEEGIYLNGEDAKKHLEKLSFEKEESTEVSMLNGICACPGRIKGKVKIINIPEEMKKMEKGDVLVSIATSPDLVAAMKKASAIVTDMGGITSHAAIVSRELNIPCVVGTKIATKALKDGTLVDVDSTHGTIKILEKIK